MRKILVSFKCVFFKVEPKRFLIGRLGLAPKRVKTIGSLTLRFPKNASLSPLAFIDSPFYSVFRSCFWNESTGRRLSCSGILTDNTERPKGSANSEKNSVRGLKRH